MRISDAQGKRVPEIYLGLSDSEAAELIDALSDLQRAGQGWHAHVSDPSLQVEISVYREDDPTARFADPSE